MLYKNLQRGIPHEKIVYPLLNWQTEYGREIPAFWKTAGEHSGTEAERQEESGRNRGE
jgi:hypothetical protein